jgi:type II secretory pathway pseudopilin PulG
MRIKKQKGFALITLILAMVLMTALGAGIYSVTTSSTLGELLAGKDYNAYQLAKAGMRYAALNGADFVDGTKYTFCMSGAQCFELSSSTDAGVKNYTSRGYVNAGTFLAASRSLTYELAFILDQRGTSYPPNTIADPEKLIQLADSSSSEDHKIGVGDLDYFRNDMLVDGKPVLTADQLPEVVDDRSTRAAYVALTPAEAQPLANEWCYAGDFLSYDAQVKVAVGMLDNNGNFIAEIPGYWDDHHPPRWVPPVPGPSQYMLGLGLRYVSKGHDEDTMLGVSFVRSDKVSDPSDHIPNTIVPSDSLVNKPMIVLWAKTGTLWDGTDPNNAKWLAYQDLSTSNNNVITTSATDAACPAGVACIKKWSTITARIVEAASIKLSATSAPELTEGTIIKDASDRTAKVIKTIADADGTIVVLLNNVTAGFSMPATIGSNRTTTAWRARDNYVWAFYGDTDDHPAGTEGDKDPTNQTRLKNQPQGTLFYPSKDIVSWDKPNDHSTLVKWTGIRDTSCTYTSSTPGSPCTYKMGGGYEQDSIIRYNATYTITDPATYTAVTNEIGLVAIGPLAQKGFFLDFDYYTPSLGGSDRVTGVQSAQFDGAGGADTYSVNTYSDCPWTTSFVPVAPSTGNWVTFTPATYTGSNATAIYTVAANDTASPRTGIMKIAGLSFTVSQAGGVCAYGISPNSYAAPAGGTTSQRHVTVTTGLTSGCPWTAVSNNDWINTSGSGDHGGTVNFTVDANTGPYREGTMTIAGKPFTVTQASGCSYSISNGSGGFASAGGTGTFTVSAGAGCTGAWTATAQSTGGWLTTTSNGSAPGSGSYTVAENTTYLSRQGTISIGAGKSFTVSQAGKPCPALTIATLSLPNGRHDVAYSQTVAANGGVAPLTWSNTTGSSWPAGWSINSSSGAITGNPTAVGLYSPEVIVKDSCPTQQTATMTYNNLRILRDTYTINNRYNSTIYTQTGTSGGRLICGDAGRVFDDAAYSLQWNNAGVVFYKSRSTVSGTNNVCGGTNPLTITGASAESMDSTDYDGLLGISTSFTLINE